MKRIYLYIALLPALAVIVSCRKTERRETVVPEIDVARVVTDSVVLSRTYPGTLVASSEVELVARVDGYLTSKDYTSGDYVRKGTVLFTIEDRNYRDAVQQAEAELATARAQYEYASSRYAAMQRAYETDAVSKMEVEQSRSQTEQSAAAVKTAEAALRSARTQLSYCTVRAPFDGHMTLANYNVGAYVAGQGAPVTLAKIIQDKEIYVDFAIEDAEALANLKAQVTANPILFDSIKVSFAEPLAHRYTARLNYMAPSVDRSTGTIKLQAYIENPYGELRDGMYATVELPSGTDPRAMLVRDASIGTDQLGNYIYVVNDSDRVVYTSIKTGAIVADTMRLVTEGVRPGERYVTKALMKVRDGMTVKPVMR